MRIIAQLEFELSNYYITAQQFSPYTTAGDLLL